MPDSGKQSRSREVSRMLGDAVLPAEIRPGMAFVDRGLRVALLTGAAGFLGRYVARELLQQSDLQLVCLVREKENETAGARMERILSGVGVSQADLASRVEVLVGDVTEPKLGLGDARYKELVQRVDTIYHCAAKVDWVRGYAHLHRMNVGGVLAMIRLACQGPTKRLLFVSSVAACFAWNGPEHVDEDTDMLPFIGDMPLGYARSKCVAEALLRQAGERGVPVTVLRPSLISGDSTTGVSNQTDLIAAMIEASVVTGITIDTDWLLDCVPVDYVAQVMAGVPQAGSNWLVLNLRHENPRHWREMVLWMNLHGYPVKMVDSDTWVRRQFIEQGARGTLLYGQRQFFSGNANREGEARPARPYEAYLATSQTRIDTDRTHALLAELGIHEAPLDADLLHAYFDDYRRVGLLPPTKTGDQTGLTLDELLSGHWVSRGRQAGRHGWVADKQSLMGSDNGLLSEIAAARVKGSAGLRRLHSTEQSEAGEAGPASAVLKAKVSDRLLEDLTVTMAGVCRPEMGRLFERFKDALGLDQCHERELVLYEMEEPRLARHMPACYGSLRDPDVGRWALLLEYLPEADERASRRRIRADGDQMQAILNGLADIHAIWYRHDEGLAQQARLAVPPDTARMMQMLPLWRELADFAQPCFQAWCGPSVVELQSQVIGSLDQWWPRLQAMPATLIHNDFNPRNFVVREINSEQQLCVYDWELATLGIPQHDLAELLCFTWHGSMTGEDLDRLLSTYQEALSTASGVEIDTAEWREGFVLSLRQLLINRLALYTLMHYFRPLDYLPRVMSSWMRLYEAAERLRDSCRNSPAHTGINRARSSIVDDKQPLVSK